MQAHPPASGAGQQGDAIVTLRCFLIDLCLSCVLQLRQLITDTVPFATDAHIRVRHAALRTLGQLTLDFTDPDAIDTVTAGDAYAPSTGRDGELS